MTTSAVFHGEKRQIDHYYNSPHRDFLKPFHPLEYLRIREKGNETILAYKHIHLNDRGENTHADEFQANFDSADQVKRILEVLNFQEFLQIDNTRKEYLYREDFEIDLDEVADLGYFIEIESRRLFDSIEKTSEKIIEVARELGIDPLLRNNDGYVLAMMKKKGLR